MDFGAKYKALIKHTGRFDICEGTTYSGKTTVGFGVKLMLEIAQSKKRFHGIAGKDLSTAEKNIINAEKGILNEWGDYVQYLGNGTSAIKLPHIVFNQDRDTQKIIYVFGYDDKKRWEKVLGGQLGCLGVDEANIANLDFLQEAAIRQDYMIWTLNPDDPELPVYKNFIDHSRPLDRFRGDYPRELLEQLCLDPVAGRTHWYFTFNDNIACDEEKKQQIMQNAVPGTKLHKNKILGLRGVGQGVMYDPLLQDTELLNFLDLNTNAFEEIVATVDVGKSVNADDPDKAHTIVHIGGYTKNYHRVVPIASKKINSIEHRDIIEEAENWLYPYWLKLYGKFSTILIDNAEYKLISTWQNHTRWPGKFTIRGCVKNHKVFCPNLVARASIKCQLMMKSKQYPTSRIAWCDKDMLHAHRQILQDKDGSELDQGNIYNDYGDCLSYLIIWRAVQIFADRKERNNKITFH